MCKPSSTSGRISFFGKERNIIGDELNKHMLQGMASAKDVKILDREEDLIHQVDKNVFKMSRLNHIMKFINAAVESSNSNAKWINIL